MRLNLALSNAFVTAACVAVLAVPPVWVGANVNPSQEQRYFHEVALKWGQLANKPVEGDTPAVLKAGISTYVSQYRLDTGDIITVNIPDLELSDPNFKVQPYKTALYQSEYQVDRDGLITIPSFGSFKVSGLTTQQTSRMLEEMASYYLKNPRVYTSIKQTRPYSIYVKGEIRHPGSYQILSANSSAFPAYGNISSDSQDIYLPKVSMMIKKAGGILPTSDLENIEIINDRTNKRVLLNLKRMILDGDSLQDVLLEPDDVVVIPKGNVNNHKVMEIAASTLSPDKYQVKILGFVNRTSVGTVELDSRSMTVSHALNKLNIDPDANLKRITVLRKDPLTDKYQSITVNVLKGDLALEPEDTILVTHKRLSTRIKYLMQGIIGPFGQAAFGLSQL